MVTSNIVIGPVIVFFPTGNVAPCFLNLDRSPVGRMIEFGVCELVVVLVVDNTVEIEMVLNVLILEVVKLLNSDVKFVARIVELEIAVRVEKLVFCIIKVVLVIVELEVCDIFAVQEGILGIGKLVFWNTKVSNGFVMLYSLQF